jgi:hypothetical protein
MSQKKLQVFVSSTYQDLREERQAAVEAILTAGHIPAGMELFAAGDDSQMNVIKRWIDESDVFLLILGGRYGSLEPITGKSYIHLEYDYAVQQGKPFFAVAIDELHRNKRVKKMGVGVIETEHPDKLRVFRDQVLTRLVKFWSDPRDIKLAVHETMADFARRTDLIGWVRSNQTGYSAQVAEELARLVAENAELRTQIVSLNRTSETYNGLLFSELVTLLRREQFNAQETTHDFDRTFVARVVTLARESNAPPSLLHSLWFLRELLIPYMNVESEEINVVNTVNRLQKYGIVEYLGTSQDEPNNYSYAATRDGSKFLLRMTFERSDVFRRIDKQSELPSPADNA